MQLLTKAEEGPGTSTEAAKKVVFEYSLTAENGQLARQQRSLEPIVSAESSRGETVSGPATSVDHGHILASPQENSRPQGEVND
jgi:hypothetical protein